MSRCPPKWTERDALNRSDHCFARECRKSNIPFVRTNSRQVSRDDIDMAVHLLHRKGKVKLR